VAVEQHHDHGLAGGRDRVEQILLVAREVELAAAVGLTLMKPFSPRASDLLGVVGRRDGVWIVVPSVRTGTPRLG
jgi:hypothetical protein